MQHEVDVISQTLIQFGIKPFIFVDNYKFASSEEKQMMQQAMRDIDNCDVLIAETTDKGIGIGIEAGYAKGKGKPVVYLRQSTAEHSTTLSGISDFQIIYSTPDDLAQQLTRVVIDIGRTMK